MRSRKRPRLEGFDYIGKHRYFLTFCTHERRSFFEDERHVSLVSAQILRTCGERWFEILAHVYMPDHLHLVVKGTTDTSDLRCFAALAKQKSAFEFARATTNRLWQPSYFDRWIRPEESELMFVRYVLENPVRAGLVSRCEEYPHAGAGVWTVSEMMRILDQAGIEVWNPRPADEKSSDDACDERQP